MYVRALHIVVFEPTLTYLSTLQAFDTDDEHKHDDKNELLTYY